jgi:hypothetical protein
MAHIKHGILAAMALVAGFGAVQLALGGDLDPTSRAAQSVDATVNRDAKSDRAGAPSAIAQGQTISVRLDDQASSSILVRIPDSVGEARRSPLKQPERDARQKAVIACEPVVSVLTDIAKQLQPGRCVT